VSRQLIIVDTETTGLQPNAAVLEVAAVNVVTGAELHFVPYITPETLHDADPKALQINRYYERGVFEQTFNQMDTNSAWFKLRRMLDGNTFGGSNPTFDANHVKLETGEVWHHRLADLSPYAAGVLGIPVTELPGLNVVCDALGVVNQEAHSALGDARATAECFRKLALRIEERFT
jgi:DNA polymerase-3 subunit epsilon